MANGYFTSKFEAGSPGTETAASGSYSTKVIYVPVLSTSPKQGADHLERDDELRNIDEPLPVIPEAYDPSWDLETRMYPDSIGFFLKSLLGTPVTTTGNGVITDPDVVTVPTGAYRHVWTAPFLQSNTPVTMESVWAYKDQGVFFRQRGMATDSLSIETPEKGGARAKVGGQSLYMNRIADPSLTATYESLSVRPFTRGNLTLSWLAGSAFTEDFTLSAVNPVETTHSLAAASKYPDLMERAVQGLITFSGSIPKRSINATDWDAFVNATGFAATAKWVSDSIIASGYPYKLFTSFTNVQLTSGELDDLGNKRRHGASYGWKATNAGAASVTITLVNATASYA